MVLTIGAYCCEAFPIVAEPVALPLPRRNWIRPPMPNHSALLIGMMFTHWHKYPMPILWIATGSQWRNMIRNRSATPTGSQFVAYVTVMEFVSQLLFRIFKALRIVLRFRSPVVRTHSTSVT